LVEGGEGAQLDPPPQGGLPDQQGSVMQVIVVKWPGKES